jgi:NADPH:quinone reductase-like Zn-dependent oxidoreductase
MKAIIGTRYGSPDVLQLKEVATPTPKADEALVRIHAASLSGADSETLRGTWAVRIGGPLRPRFKVLGSDIAGRIERVGRDVREYQPGDEVWADLSEHGFGAFAEYVCVPESALRLKPASMTFEEAAAVPESGLLALTSLRHLNLLGVDMPAEWEVRPGQKVLINGAGGGVGTFAVQIAKYYGAEVTGVDNAGKLDRLLSLGADHVIDYRQQDYTRTGQRYDVVLDTVARRSMFSYRRALSPEGIFVMIGGSFIAIFQGFALGPLISKRDSRRMGVNMWKPNSEEAFVLLTQLIEAGKVVPIIDSVYPLNELPEALRHLEEGRAFGKVVITM